MRSKLGGSLAPLLPTAPASEPARNAKPCPTKLPSTPPRAAPCPLFAQQLSNGYLAGELNMAQVIAALDQAYQKRYPN